MAEIPGIPGDKQKMYHMEVILKKEGKTWIEYYAVLVGTSLIFNRKDEKTGRIIPHNLTMIDITNKTQCGFGENKTCYRFPFWLQNGKAKYQFKCETKLHRHKWMFAIRLCAAGKPPEPLPKMIPTKNTTQRARNGTKTNSSSHSNNNINTAAFKSSQINGGSTTKSTITAKGVNTKPTPATTKPGVVTTNRQRSNTIDSEQNQPPTTVDKFSTSNGFKMYNRSKSFDSPRENTRTAKNREEKSNKLLASDSKKSGAGSNNRAEKHKDAKSNSSRLLRSKTITDQSDQELHESVLQNQYVRDSMSDIRPSTLEIPNLLSMTCQNNMNNNNKNGRPSSNNDLTPTNEPFRCVSCKENFSSEHLHNAGRIGDKHNTESHNGATNPHSFEYGLNEKGEKVVQKVQLQPHFVDLDEPVGLDRYFRPTADGGKTPVEHDELDSYPSVKMKYRTDGHIETFTLPSTTTSPAAKAFSRNNSNLNAGNVIVDRFGKIRKISNNSSPPSSLPASRKTSLQNRHVFIPITERAQSWASLQRRGHKDPEAQRRENSAPSLRFSRHKLNPNNNTAHESSS